MHNTTQVLCTSITQVHKSLLQISVRSAKVLTAYHSIEFVPGDVENDSIIHKSVQKDTSAQSWDTGEHYNSSNLISKLLKLVILSKLSARMYL